jgi:hypothetical protein
MATAGQLKAKIDVLKKKLASKGEAMTPLRRRQAHKRLKRLQRARRVAAAGETRTKRPAKEGAETAPAESAQA